MPALHRDRPNCTHTECLVDLHQRTATYRKRVIVYELGQSQSLWITHNAAAKTRIKV